MYWLIDVIESQNSINWRQLETLILVWYISINRLRLSVISNSIVTNYTQNITLCLVWVLFTIIFVVIHKKWLFRCKTICNGRNGTHPLVFESAFILPYPFVSTFNENRPYLCSHTTKSKCYIQKKLSVDTFATWFNLNYTLILIF